MSICIPSTTNWSGRKPVLTPAPVDPDNPTDEEAAALAALGEQIHLAEAFAWTTLAVLTAHQLAICPITVRPCGKDCNAGAFFVPWGVRPLYGSWIPLWCGCTGECSCTATHEVVLPGPVGDIVEVKIGTDIIPSSEYRVDYAKGRAVLVRSGDVGWPLCQDMDAAAGEDGAFTVTYMHGAIPDEMDNYAAGVLAYEFYIAMTDPKGKCRLPNGVRSVSRNGVTYDIQDDLFEGGYTGISEVDVVIRRRNPYRVLTPSAVATPETLRRQPRVTTRQF